MKTKIIVDADMTGFEPFEIPDLKYIPRRGEHFKIDEKKYPAQAARIALEEQVTGIVCRVWYVEHEFVKGTQVLTINLYCAED